jgi:hypothetical protein
MQEQEGANRSTWRSWSMVSPHLRRVGKPGLRPLVPKVGSPARASHILNEGLRAYESNLANTAQLVQVLNFPKLPRGDMCGIVSLNDHCRE